MIYEDFVRTLLARMGLPYEKADAGAARDGVDRLVRLSAMVDDLLAEAGYDTLFDTREKCLEALRQDIKAKLGTAPVDREVLAFKLAEAADPAYQASVLNRAYWLRAADAALRLIRPAPAAKVVDQEGLAKAMLEAMFKSSNAATQWSDLGDIGKHWWRDLAASALKYIGATSTADETRARDLLSYEVRGLRTELADAQRQVGVWRDTAETQNKMRLDLAAEQDKIVSALDEAQNQLVAERKKWPELKAEVERLKLLVRARELTIALFEKIVLGHADPGAVLRDAETGETAHIAPDVRVALHRLIDRARSSERLREANSELADALVARKPLDRDRIRLALLDFDPKVNTVGFINDLADHLLKRLA